MRRFVRKYTAACLNCAFAKGAYGKGEGYLHPIDKQNVPFDTIHIDHVGPFVKSVKMNSYILMIVDAFSKFVLAKPTRTLSSAEVIDILRWVFGEFGYPRRIISDQGLAFASKAFGDFLVERGVKHVLNAVATPRANNQVERPNRTIVEAITATANSEAQWDDRLPEIVWGINHTTNSSTGASPASFLFAFEGWRMADLAGDSQTSHAAETARVQAARQKASDRMTMAARRMKA